MITRDPLADVEQTLIVDTVASLARHDVRNRLAAIRNASYYLRKKVEPTEVWRKEPRMERFFGLIDEEIVAADTLVSERLARRPVDDTSLRSVGLGELVDHAITLARAVPESGFDVDVAGTIVVVPAEIAVALRALLENAAEAVPTGRISVRAEAAVSAVRIVIADEARAWSQPFEEAVRPLTSTKPGRAGLGLAIADRAVRRHSGTLSLVDGAVAMELPEPLGDVA